MYQLIRGIKKRFSDCFCCFLIFLMSLYYIVYFLYDYRSYFQYMFFPEKLEKYHIKIDEEQSKSFAKKYLEDE